MIHHTAPFQYLHVRTYIVVLPGIPFLFKREVTPSFGNAHNKISN